MRQTMWFNSFSTATVLMLRESDQAFEEAKDKRYLKLLNEYPEMQRSLFGRQAKD